MYRTILFDFDGTVFDTGEGIMKSVRYAAEAFGYQEPDLEALRCFVGPPLRGQFMKRYGVDAGTAEKMVAKYRERYSVKGLGECSVYPGVPELVRELRSMGKNVAIATGKPTAFTVSILERAGYGELFDAVLGSEFDGTRSKKSEVIAELLEKYGRDGAAMIGDRDNDVLGAKECGIPCIGVAWGYAEPGELLKAGAISLAETVDELRNILIG
ncbi:MAG TPA: HAD hydrolase-like protein [Candidatus Scatomorpha intestinavium]|uniref:HAD hydrolase-like protein n=1 Tax=Candidatus Scatomorpha intestinavium TaxID=2840922 RepID=A0A9D0ZF69_9FIRM|nr:HAD hydrolase-like protein [Candidatus Scatomorpha intestinavium]